MSTINFRWADFESSATFKDGPEDKTYDIVVIKHSEVDNCDGVFVGLVSTFDEERDVRCYLLAEYSANGVTASGINTQNYEYSTSVEENNVYCFELVAHNTGYDDSADQFIPFDNTDYRDYQFPGEDQIECYKARTEQFSNFVCAPSTTTDYEIDCTTDALTTD